MAYRPSSVTAGHKLGLWLRRLPGSRFIPWRYIVVGAVDAADEVPDVLAPRTAIVVKATDRATWVAFNCPRHSHEKILLNLSNRRRPFWTIEAEHMLTLRPSIDAHHGGTRCHFWISRGRIKWAKVVRSNDRRN